ncbi:acyl-[acyl-carrier-protein] desaturase [Catenulispora sp. EB89]|uniref:acyl-ACP desaturase n=1 Tax=Catenulispora sp. EB89 TaxID=3156257 RepID=UPI0035176E83
MTVTDLPRQSARPTNAMSEAALLSELEQVVEENLNRHLSTAKEWFPHEYVPWSEGENFDGVMQGKPWSPDQSRIPDIARTSLVLNLMTEDNLPSYHRAIAVQFGQDGAWGTWVHRWTAEEGRHGIAIRDYLLTTRAVDPVALERERMTHMSNGYSQPDSYDAVHSVAYVSFQELATRIAHRNTGKVSGDPDCERLLARVAQDENLHMLFYRNLLSAAFELDPDQTMRAVTNVVQQFQMPGSGLQDFNRKSVMIAKAGIYDLRIHHDEVLMPILRQTRALERDDLGAEGEIARTELAEFMEGLDTAAARFCERREALLAKQAARREK